MKTILSFSGGLDSSILLYWLLQQGHEVRCLSVDYDQRHRRELEAAKKLATGQGCEHVIADLRPLSTLFAGSSQTSKDVEVPHGHYAAENMKLTVVPNRNMVLLALATAWAVSTKSQAVAYAAHAGDHAIYPDCRPEFTEGMQNVMKLCDWHPVELLRPFIQKSKADIVKLGQELGVPFEQTYSCYEGQETHCGKCGTCVERLEAFQLAKVTDPTRYQ